jgi:hypothetical protein
MRKLIVIMVVLMTGCASIEPSQFVGPNGKTAYSMDCSGMGRTLDACYKKAGEICPSGYLIVNSASGTVGVPLANGGVLIAPQHNLAIECK